MLPAEKAMADIAVNSDKPSTESIAIAQKTETIAEQLTIRSAVVSD